MADFRKTKLNFGNPIEPNYNDISFNYEDMIDSISALQIKNASLEVFTRRNVFEGVNEYSGLIIQISTDYRPPGLWDLAQNTFGEDTQYVYFKAHIPPLHSSIGSPCDIGYLNRFGTTQEKIQAALKRIQNHPWFFATYKSNIFVNRAPTFGDIVKIKFLKNPSSGKIIQGEIVEILSRGNGESLDDLCGQSNKDLFGGYNPNYGSVQLGSFNTPSTNARGRSGKKGIFSSKFNNADCASPVFSLIARGEGSYESINNGNAGDIKVSAQEYLGKKLVEHTIAEIRTLQSGPNRKLFAVGKYQIIPDTMPGFVEGMKLADNTLFNEQTQELFPFYTLDSKRPIVGEYLAGTSDDITEAGQALAREFASVGLQYTETYEGNTQQRGSSLYAGSGGNRASISPDQITAALQQARTRCLAVNTQVGSTTASESFAE